MVAEINLVAMAIETYVSIMVDSRYSLRFFFAALPRYEVCIARHMHVTPLYFLSYTTEKRLFVRKLSSSTNV